MIRHCNNIIRLKGTKSIFNELIQLTGNQLYIIKTNLRLPEPIWGQLFDTKKQPD